MTGMNENSWMLF